MLQTIETIEIEDACTFVVQIVVAPSLGWGFVGIDGIVGDMFNTQTWEGIAA